MRALTRIARQYVADEDGATAIEYVIIAASLTLALVPGFYWVSDAMTTKFGFLISFILG